MNNKIVKFIQVVLMAIFLNLIYWICTIDTKNLFIEDFKPMEKNMALDMMDSVKLALNKFKHLHGHYPLTSSKYFIDSLQGFVEIPGAFLYQDKDVNGEINSVRFESGKYKNTYIAIGRSENIIVYRSFPDDTYKLYYAPPQRIDSRK